VSQPALTSFPLWPDHVTRVNEVFKLALQLLLLKKGLPTRETALNRELCRCVKEANGRLLRQGRGITWPITYDGPHGPDEQEDEVAEYEDKRPDFKWGMIDIHNADAEVREMMLDIECKRLGRRTGNWHFNKNYVDYGVQRFRTMEHSYGRNVERGTMIGYVQNMEMDDILAEINHHGSLIGMVAINIEETGWEVNGINNLVHQFDRPYTISPFELRHVWVDLRHKYLVASDGHSVASES